MGIATKTQVSNDKQKLKTFISGCHVTVYKLHDRSGKMIEVSWSAKLHGYGHLCGSLVLL